MSIKVVVGEAKPCSDLARRLAMVYELILRRAEEVETGHKEACEGREAGGNPSRGQREANLNNRIATLHDPPWEVSQEAKRDLTKWGICGII